MGLIFLKNSKVGMFFLISISFISCKSYQKIGGENSNYIPYYLKVYEADSLFLLKNYSSAYEKYDNVFITNHHVVDECIGKEKYLTISRLYADALARDVDTSF